MQQQTSDEDGNLNFSARDVAAALSRRKRLAVTLFLAGLIVAALVALLLPNKYESRMRILVKASRADVIVTPERTNGPVNDAPEGITEARINSEIQLLTSKDLLQQVVKDNSLDQPTGSWLGGESDPAIRAEKATRQLEKTLRIGPIKKSSLIEVRYEAASPQAAATVLKRLSELYLEKHLKVHRPSGTHEFFAAQTAAYEQQLREAQARLSQYQINLNVVSLDAEKDLNLRKLVEARSNLLTTDAALSDVAQRIESAQRELARLEPRVVTQSRVLPYQQSVESLSTMLVELRNRRTQLLTKFRPEDRLLKEVEQQIKDTSAALETARKQTAVEQSSNLNPLRQTMESELGRARLERAGLQAKRETLAGQVRDYEALLLKLEQGTAGYDALTRQVKTLADNYQLYARKRDESLIADALDQQKISNVSVAEAPTLSPLPSSPNRGLILALGAFLAGFGGLSGVVAAELLGDRLAARFRRRKPADKQEAPPWSAPGYAD